MTETLGDWERPGTGPTRQTDDLQKRDALRRELDRLYDEAARLEAALDERLGGGQPPGRRGQRSLVPAGLLIGFVAASGSLILHVIVSLLMGGHPLQMVRAALYWIQGEPALSLETGPALAFGTCLFLVLGATVGVPLHQTLNRWFGAAPGIWRFLVATAIALVLWIAGGALLHGTPLWLTGFTAHVYVYLILLLENWGREGPAR